MSTQLDRIEAMSIKPDDVVVLSYQNILTQDQRVAVAKWAERNLPAGQKVFVIDGGATIGILGNDERMARIEAKLDSLITALAEDDPEQEPGVDLDGNDVGGERDTTQTL